MFFFVYVPLDIPSLEKSENFTQPNVIFTFKAFDLTCFRVEDLLGSARYENTNLGNVDSEYVVCVCNFFEV